MQVHFIPQRARRDNRILLVTRSHMLKRVKRLGIDHSPFFNPADLVLIGLDAEKPPAVFQHFERLSVNNLAYAIRYRGDAVVKVHLPGRNVDRLMRLAVQPTAS